LSLLNMWFLGSLMHYDDELQFDDLFAPSSKP